MRKIKKIIALAMCVIMLGSILPTLSVKAANSTQMITSNLEDGKVVNLLSGELYNLVKNYDYTKLPSAEYWNANKDEMEQINLAPEAVKISWNCKEEALYYTFKIADNENLLNARSYMTFDKSIKVEDLCAGKKYFYQIVAFFENKTVKSQIFSLQTADSTRTIYVDGVENTRDIGGYKTSDGNRIRQGMVYRGGNVDSITDAGRQKMYRLGIKTDLDLRKPSKLNSPIGNDINLITVDEKGAPQYRYWYGIDIWSDVNTEDEKKHAKNALINEIRTFANKDNYPIYVHCAIGRDRTGTICFLINALCGVEKNDLYKDYELSMLSKATHAEQDTPEMMVNYHLKNLVNLIEEQTGKNLAEKTATYMKRLGITDKEIQSIRDIMIEKTTSKSQKNSTNVKAGATALTNSGTNLASNLELTNVKKVSGQAQQIEEKEFVCECSATTRAQQGQYVCYGAKNVDVLSKTEAEEKGIPEGYIDSVVLVDGENTANYKGVFCDFSAYKIPISIVESITFRVYAGANGVELRIPKQGGVGQHWTMRYDISNSVNKWTDVVLNNTGTNFQSQTSMENLSKDGYLDKLELALKANAEGEVFYIDSIKVKLKADDKTAPVINYDKSTIELTENSKMIDITAYDSAEKRNVEVEYVWQDGVTLNENHIPNKQGTYNLTLRATDFYGNTTEKNVTVKVKQEDKEAPDIHLNIKDMYVVTGTIPCLNVDVTDNSEMKPTVSMEWSKGALSKSGTLTTGTHTLTINAKDSSENKSQKVVTVYVSEKENLGNNVIDEESLYYCINNGHSIIKQEKVNATCTKDGIETYYMCSKCKKIFADEKGTKEINSPEIIKKHRVTYVKAVAATYAKTGMKAHYKCSCGKLYTDVNCKNETSKIKLIVNKLTVTKTSIKKVTAKSKSLKISWKKKNGVTGYEVQVALKKNFKTGLKKATIKGAGKTSLTVKKLKSKKNYYIRVRAYKKVGSKKYYSKWSSVNRKKTK